MGVRDEYTIPTLNHWPHKMPGASQSAAGAQSADDKTRFGVSSAFRTMIASLSGLKLWWKLDEATGVTAIVDASGNGNNGTLTAGVGNEAPTWQAPTLIGDPSAYAMASCSFSNYITGPNLTAPTPLAIIFVCRPIAIPPDGVTYQDIGGNPGLRIQFYQDEGAIQVQASGSEFILTGSGLLVPGRRSLFVLTVDASNVGRLYIDRTLRYTNGVGGAPANWSAGFGVGRIRQWSSVLSDVVVCTGGSLITADQVIALRDAMGGDIG
jgi:hypothetical protein